MGQPRDSRLTIRVPEILKARADKYIEVRRGEFSRYCFNDCVLDALRALLDGPGIVSQVIENGWDGTHLKTPMPEIGNGHSVGVSYWDNWSRKSKSLEGDARDESFREALRQRQAEGLQLPPKWGKMFPQARMAWLRQNDREDF